MYLGRTLVFRWVVIKRSWIDLFWSGYARIKLNRSVFLNWENTNEKGMERERGKGHYIQRSRQKRLVRVEEERVIHKGRKRVRRLGEYQIERQSGARDTGV